MQNSLPWLFLALCGFSAGLLVSAGVFTVLLAVGLTPRFVGKTHTGKKILLYESCIMSGAVLGTIFSVIPDMMDAGGRVREWIAGWGTNGENIYGALADSGMSSGIINAAGETFLGVAGLFMGMFVGTLALAIAEMLNSIPIFSRRISYRHGLGLAVLAVALGKAVGSFVYFWLGCFFPG